MPRPPDTPDVRASKALAYILRHGAEKEGLHMRSDGYIRLEDVRVAKMESRRMIANQSGERSLITQLARPKLRDVDKAMVLRLVEDNAKKRFELFYGYDPSPPRPKKGRGQGKGKAKSDSRRGNTAVQVGETAQLASKPQPGPDPILDAAPSSPTANAAGEHAGSSLVTAGADPAEVDDVRAALATTSIAPPTSTELPLVSVPIPNESDPTVSGPSDVKGEYFIRASQGHSLKLDDAAHLELVKDDEEGRRRVGLMVHGTKWELWDTLREEGLSRMQRQHIHLAPALDLKTHHITPRPASTLLIYLDLGKLVADGIPVYVSANGVVLTPGNERGVVERRYWRLAERVRGGLQGDRTVVWENGNEV